MSNSIWKMPDQKPTSGKWICIFDGFDYQFDNPNPDCWDDMFVEKWCDFYDLIAQADKAERLQKGLEDIKNQLEYRACLECKHCNQQLNAIEILKDVEQLIKGE